MSPNELRRCNGRINTAATAVQDLQDIQDSVYPEDTKYVDDLVYRH